MTVHRPDGTVIFTFQSTAELSRCNRHDATMQKASYNCWVEIPRSCGVDGACTAHVTKLVIVACQTNRSPMGSRVQKYLIYDQRNKLTDVAHFPAPALLQCVCVCEMAFRCLNLSQCLIQVCGNPGLDIQWAPVTFLTIVPALTEHRDIGTFSYTQMSSSSSSTHIATMDHGVAPELKYQPYHLKSKISYKSKF